MIIQQNRTDTTEYGSNTLLQTGLSRPVWEKGQIMVKVTNFRFYCGDIDLEYGGTFFDLSDLCYGYVPYLDVIDLDSACGIANCVLVERGIVIVDEPHINTLALRSCELTWHKLKLAFPNKQDRWFWIAEAVKSYGYTDPDDQFPKVLLWTPFDDQDDPPEASSWEAELVKLPDDQDVFSYLFSNGYLGDFE